MPDFIVAGWKNLIGDLRLEQFLSVTADQQHAPREVVSKQISETGREYENDSRRDPELDRQTWRFTSDVKDYAQQRAREQ